LQYLSNGALDGASVFWQREGEGAVTVAALAWICNGATGGVMEIAEFFLPQTGAAAAVAVGEDVAALVTLGYGIGLLCVDDGVLHGVTTPTGEIA
jgi:hypothetical protein